MRFCSASRGSDSPVALDSTSTPELGARSSSFVIHSVPDSASPSVHTRGSIPSRDSFIFPSAYNQAPQVAPGSLPNIPLSTSFVPSSPYTKASSSQNSDLSASTSTLDSTNTVQNLLSGVATPRGRDMSHPTAPPSALSILLSKYADGVTPRGPQTTQRSNYPQGFAPLIRPEAMVNHGMSTRSEVPLHASPPVTETTPLLSHLNGSGSASNGHSTGPSKHPRSYSKRLSGLVRGLIGETRDSKTKELGRSILKSLPAVLLGTLLNILDGVSCALVFQLLLFFAL